MRHLLASKSSSSISLLVIILIIVAVIIAFVIAVFILFRFLEKRRRLQGDAALAAGGTTLAKNPKGRRRKFSTTVYADLPTVLSKRSHMDVSDFEINDSLEKWDDVLHGTLNRQHSRDDDDHHGLSNIHVDHDIPSPSGNEILDTDIISSHPISISISSSVNSIVDDEA